MSEQNLRRLEAQLKRIQNAGLVMDAFGNPLNPVEKQNVTTEATLECLMCHSTTKELVDGYLCTVCYQKYENGEE